MPNITLDNFSEATNEQIYAYLVARLGKKPSESRVYGHLLLEPEENQRVIASKLALCRAYCQDPDRIALEYERYREAGFDPLNYGQLAFIINNLDVLDVLHRHSLPFANPNIPQILEIYEQEMREQYRDRMLEAVIEALVIDIPQDQKDLSDFIVMRNAIRELDQYLARYVDLLSALDVNDDLIREALGISRAAKSSKQKIEIENIDNPYTLRMELEKRYVIAAMAEDKKFMKFLDIQYQEQLGRLSRLNQENIAPAIPSASIDGLITTAHLHNFNEKLYNRDLKIHLNPKDVEKKMAIMVADRGKFMSQTRRATAKKAPAEMRFIASDTKESISEDVEYVSSYVGNAISAVQNLLNTLKHSLSFPYGLFQDRLDVVRDELHAIKEDAKDIYNEENKYAAGYKLMNLIWNLSQLVMDLKQYIQINALTAIKGVAVALTKVTGLMEPLTNAVSKLVPEAVKKAAMGPGLKTTQRREQRQNPERNTRIP